MSLTKLEQDLNYHQALSDTPNINEGLTPTQIKQRYDQAANDIKDYINNTLTVDIESGYASKSDIQDIYAGQMPDGSIKDDKLSNDPGQIKDVVKNHTADYVKHPGYAVATGPANTYSVTLSPAPTTYVDGMGVIVKINADSTGTATLNINGLGTRMISGKVKAGNIYSFRYNATDAVFTLQGSSSGNATPADLLAGKTATTDTGEIVGTMPYHFGDEASAGYDGTFMAQRMYMRPSQGYWNGARSIYVDDPNFIAANIANGVPIFGLVGTNANKEYATGTGITVGTQNAATVVSGIGFIPKTIIVMVSQSGNVEYFICMDYLNSNSMLFPNSSDGVQVTAGIYIKGSYSSQQLIAMQSPNYIGNVSLGTFDFRSFYPSASYKYWAFG